MKTMIQLIRQPMKSLSGILLVTLAVAILITCVGQYVATKLTMRDLDQNYNTVAVPNVTYRKDSYGNDTGALTADAQSQISKVIHGNPHLVKTISDNGLFSAYIPGLVADNPTQYDGDVAVHYFNSPNCCALLEVTLTEIGMEYTENAIVPGPNDSPAGVKSITLTCRGTVDRVLAIQEGYRDPSQGMTVVLNIMAADEAALETMDLQVGQRYLVYTSDYHDLDHEFRTIVCMSQQNFMNFSEENIFEFAPADSQILAAGEPGGVQYWFYRNQITFKGETKNHYVTFHPEFLEYLNACQVTVCDFSSLPVVYPLLDKEGWNVVKWLTNDDVRVYFEPGTVYSDGPRPLEYEAPNIARDTFVKYYATPTIAPLTGTAEEFLASEEGALWRQALEETEINNHAFPVLTVDKAGYIGDFAREQIKLTQGRDFTEEDSETGARVCILSETVANLNGLGLGDTITMNPYGYDANVTGQRSMYNPSVVLSLKTTNPGAAFYSRYLGLGESETYTIVGFYRHENPWNENSDYGITPNTILIPQNATDQETVSLEGAGIYRSYVLENGAAEEFRKLTEEAGYPALFIYYDQGYSEIKAGLDAYTGVSSRALYVGIGAYAVMLVLFILLYPLRQRENLSTMRSLGAGPADRFRHVVLSALGLLVPGTVLGCAAGLLLWDTLSAELMESVSVTVPLVSDGTGMVLTAAIQLLTALIIVCITALTMAKEKGGKR